MDNRTRTIQTRSSPPIPGTEHLEDIVAFWGGTFKGEGAPDGLAVSGSFVGKRKDMAECLEFAADGSVKADIELQPLSSINAIFERLEKGEVPSRVVLDLTGDAQVKAAPPKKEAVPA